MPSVDERQDPMGMRGAARPGGHGGDGDGDRQAGGGMPDRMRMLREHHAQTLWVYWLLVVLGLWMLFTPLTFDYARALVEPAGGHSVWLSPEARAQAMAISDVASGALLVVFGWRSLRPNRPVSLWICCFVGIWLTRPSCCGRPPRPRTRTRRSWARSSSR